LDKKTNSSKYTMKAKTINNVNDERIVDVKFDKVPSIHHRFNYEISKKYIKNKKILDIGCWTGQFIQLAQKQTRNVYGIDPNKEATQYAQKTYPSARFYNGSVEKLPFKKNTFDVVTFLEVIEHIPKRNETKALKEIARVLKKDGLLVISTPYNNPLSILLDPAFFLMGHRHYSQKQMTTLMKSNGFQIVNVYKTGGIGRLITSNIEMIYKHIFKKSFVPPKILINQIENEYKNGGFAEIHLIAQKVV